MDRVEGELVPSTPSEAGGVGGESGGGIGEKFRIFFLLHTEKYFF